MTDKVSLDFTEITRRIKDTAFPAVDAVVGIATGGTVPASLVAFELGVPLQMLHINYRAPDNSPQREAPAVLSSLDLLPTPATILLVDDVAVSGQTLAAAKAQLDGYTVITLVLKGKGDYVMFPEVAACVNWPWHPHTTPPTDPPE